MDSETFLEDMQRLERNAKGCIAVSALPANGIQTIPQPIPDIKNLQVRTFSRSIDKKWRVSSYSSLISGRTPDHELPDRDELTGLQYHSGPQTLENESGVTQTNGEPSIFSFPKGSASGIFFHDILEHLEGLRAAVQGYHVVTHMVLDEGQLVKE